MPYSLWNPIPWAIALAAAAVIWTARALFQHAHPGFPWQVGSEDGSKANIHAARSTGPAALPLSIAAARSNGPERTQETAGSSAARPIERSQGLEREARLRVGDDI